MRRPRARSRLPGVAAAALLAVAACDRAPAWPEPYGDGAATGADVVALTAGDYVLPRFSPTGEWLAAAEVLVRDGFEHTQVLVLELATGQLDTVLGAGAARRYGVYAAFAGALAWDGPRRLTATIADGDVGGTAVTVDLDGRRIVREQPLDDDWISLPQPLARLAARLEKLYPAIRAPAGFPEGVFAGALRARGLVLGDTGVILQKSFAGFDDDIWYYDRRRPHAVRIVALPPREIHAFGGGFEARGVAVFGVRREGTAEIYAYAGGDAARLLARLGPSSDPPVLRPRHVDDRGAWLVAVLHQSHERGHNPAFWFDGRALHPLGEELGELHDMDVHVRARRVAFARWVGEHRAIVVRELLVR